MDQSGRPQTAAVVSAFNPQQGLIENCRALLRQCTDVVVVDDGSPAPEESTYDALTSLGCVVVRLPSNGGIAAALNAGVLEARALNPRLDYILTMDQDSLVEDGFVATMHDAAVAARAAGVHVGMVAPGKVSGLPGRIRRMENSIAIGDEPVQSGLLIPVASLDTLGLFDAGLFIDGVDSDFYLRAKARKLKCVVAQKAGLSHSLGTMVPATLGPLRPRWGGRPLLVRTAATWRYYFIARNRVLLARRYLAIEPYWVFRAVLLDIRHLLVVSILAPGRRERLSSVRFGLRDGFRGRRGPRPTP